MPARGFDVISRRGLSSAARCLHSEHFLPPQKAIFVQKRLDIPHAALYNTTCKFHIAVLCNGSTADSDSVCRGSNPFTAAKKETSANRRLFLFLFHLLMLFQRLFQPDWLARRLTGAQCVSPSVRDMPIKSNRSRLPRR